MKTELTGSQISTLKGIVFGTRRFSADEPDVKFLEAHKLIYRPESGFARITDAGKELLAKLKGTK